MKVRLKLPYVVCLTSSPLVSFLKQFFCSTSWADVWVCLGGFRQLPLALGFRCAGIVAPFVSSRFASCCLSSLVLLQMRSIDQDRQGQLAEEEAQGRGEIFIFSAILVFYRPNKFSYSVKLLLDYS